MGFVGFPQNISALLLLLFSIYKKACISSVVRIEVSWPAGVLEGQNWLVGLVRLIVQAVLLRISRAQLPG